MSSSPPPDPALLTSELERRIEAFAQGANLGDNMGDSRPMFRALAFWLLVSVAAWVVLLVLVAST